MSKCKEIEKQETHQNVTATRIEPHESRAVWYIGYPRVWVWWKNFGRSVVIFISGLAFFTLEPIFIIGAYNVANKFQWILVELLRILFIQCDKACYWNYTKISMGKSNGLISYYSIIISPVSEGSGDVMVLRRSRPPPAARRPPPAARRPQWC